MARPTSSRSSSTPSDKSPVQEEEEEEQGPEGRKSFYSTKRDAYCSLPKNALLGFARDLILDHRMEDARTLLQNLVLDKRLAHMMYFKFAMLLFDCYQSDNFQTHYNKFLLPFLTKCRHFDVDKRDMYLEFICLMVQNDNFWMAIEFFSDHSRYTRMGTLKKNRSVEAVYHCYSAYLEYWSWDRDKHKSDMKFKAIAIQSSVEKYLIKNNHVCLNFMAECVGKMLKYYNEIDSAVEFYSKYVGINDSNLSAQLHYFHFLEMQLETVESGSIKADKNQERRMSCYERIQELDGANPTVKSICSKKYPSYLETVISSVDTVKDLFAYLDYGTNKNDIDTWNTLVSHLIELVKYQRVNYCEVRKFYNENYHSYWQHYHFSIKVLEKGQERPKVLFCTLMDVCDDFVEQIFAFLSEEQVVPLKQERNEIIRLRGKQP